MSQFRRRLMMLQPAAGGFTPNDIPGCVMWLSAKGKSNSDPDREVLKDLSGNGNDASLRNFGFVEGSGYADGALVFDGVDDLGVINGMKQFEDFTFIAKRKILSVVSGYYPGVFSNGKNSFEYGNGGIAYVCSAGLVGYIPTYLPDLISYMTPTSYNGFKISKGTAVATNSDSLLGNFSYANNPTLNMALYDMIVYNRTLNDEEINKVIEYLKK